MTPFGYWRDPLFRLAVLIYGLNRWLLKPVTHLSFVHDHLNDLLLIPAALPLILWLQRKIGLRRDDAPPRAAEIFLHLLVWSFICEMVGPRWFRHGTADGWDVVAYACGGVLAWILWHRRQLILTRAR